MTRPGEEQPAGGARERCSAWARSERVLPVGTAGCYRGFVLVELPLPWPRDVHDAAEIAPVAELATRRGLRLQALVPHGGPRKVVAYTGGAGPGAPGNETADSSFGGFARREVEVGGGGVEAAVRDALGEGDGARATTDADGAVRRDLLVCTHGTRDVCCGSRGSDLWAAMGGSDLPPGTRRWRTSHTGGHRFAPTFVVLPEATVWAYADPELVERVLWRRGPAGEVADRYRGCAGLASPRVQALEKEVLRARGWSLLDCPRRGVELEGGEVRLEVAGSLGGTERWAATVEPGRTMPVPACPGPPGGSAKCETEWTVAGLTLL